MSSSSAPVSPAQARARPEGVRRSRITLIDQRNHHLFQPLLYQVATTLLATSEIAWPIRRLFRDRPDVTTLLGQVHGVDQPGAGCC